MRAPVHFFLSYAHADSADVARFRDVFEPLLQISPKYEFSGWSDHLILPGERWRQEIAGALKSCRFGLLLVSPRFLASPFITNEELPELLAKPMVAPVALQRISFDGLMDLKGLEARQVFHDSKGRSFDGCGRKSGRRDFARELMGKVGQLLEKYPC